MTQSIRPLVKFLVLGVLLVSCAKTTTPVVQDPLLKDPMVYTHWETFNVEQGLPHHLVFAVKTHGSDVYFGTENGVAITNRKTKTWSTLPPESKPGANDGVAYKVVTSVDIDEDGDAWFGTFKGLTHWDGETFTNYRWPEGQDPKDPNPKGLINNVVYGVTHLGDDIWIATTDGTSQYNKKSGQWKSWYLNNAPMEETWCYGIAATKDKIWLAAWGSGLMEYVVADNHWNAYHDPDGSFTVDLLRNDGMLSMMSTSASANDEGIVWAASYFGASRYDGKNWRDWDEDHGIPSNFLNSVKAHGDAGWICTDKGLAGFQNEQWYTYARVEEDGESYGTITIADADGKNGKVYRTETSIPQNFVWWVDFDEDGGIWVATSDGIAHGTREGGVR